MLDGEILVQNHCYRADEMALVLDMAKEFGYKVVDAKAVHANRIRTRASEALEEAVKAKLDGIPLKLFDADLPATPEKFRNKEGRGPRVFTPFWRRLLRRKRDRPAPARAKNSSARKGHHKRQTRRAGSSSRPSPTGPRAFARHGPPVNRPRCAA